MKEDIADYMFMISVSLLFLTLIFIMIYDDIKYYNSPCGKKMQELNGINQKVNSGKCIIYFDDDRDWEVWNLKESFERNKYWSDKQIMSHWFKNRFWRL